MAVTRRDIRASALVDLNVDRQTRVERRVQFRRRVTSRIAHDARAIHEVVK